MRAVVLAAVLALCMIWDCKAATMATFKGYGLAVSYGDTVSIGIVCF